MNLTKSFNGNVHDVRNLTLRKYDTGLNFTSNYDERGYGYCFEVSPLNYLSLAKKAVDELQRISGMNYCIMAKHPDSATWRALK